MKEKINEPPERDKLNNTVERSPLRQQF